MQACSNATPLTPLIEFTGVSGQKWSVEERAIVLSGAWQVAKALFEASGGQFASPREAFLAVYGGTVTFHKTGIEASNLGKEDGKRRILVNIQEDGGKITGEGSGTLWVAHELGHVFNNNLSPNRTQPKYTHGQGLIDLAQKGVWVGTDKISGAISSDSWLGDYTRGDFEGYQSNTFPYIQNNTLSASEDFADMFSNYVHNSFAANDYGRARYDFMASHMRGWIALAVSNNE